MKKYKNEFSDFDCIVVGGGSAGCGAAYAAAIAGCRTLIIETHGFIGGMGTAAGLSTFVNFHYKKRDLSGEFYRLVRKGLKKISATYSVEGGNADVFEPEALKLVLERRLREVGVHIAYHSAVFEVVADNKGWLVKLFHKSGTRDLRCRYLIDSTGDADVAVRAGVTTTHGRHSDGLTQPLSMVVQLGGVSPESFGTGVRPLVNDRYIFNSDCLAEEIDIARREGTFTIPRNYIAMLWSMPWDPTRVTINGTRIMGKSACRIEDLSWAEIEGRRQSWELMEFMRSYVPGFESAYLLATGPQIGIRESRRIVGQENLTSEDVLQSKQPPESVVLCSYPIDIHQPDGYGTDFEIPKETKDEICYGIPLGCLIPRESRNLIVAGRCISATHEAAGSFRVMPTCMTLGEAAGTAVGIAREENADISDIEPMKVRTRMSERLESEECSKA